MFQTAPLTLEYIRNQLTTDEYETSYDKFRTKIVTFATKLEQEKRHNNPTFSLQNSEEPNFDPWQDMTATPQEEVYECAWDEENECFVQTVSKGKSYWNKGKGKGKSQDKGKGKADEGKGKPTRGPWPYDCPICHQPGGIPGKSHSAERCPHNYNNYNYNSNSYYNNKGYGKSNYNSYYNNYNIQPNYNKGKRQLAQ